MELASVFVIYCRVMCHRVKQESCFWKRRKLVNEKKTWVE